jgi:hypothetical protein
LRFRFFKGSYGDGLIDSEGLIRQIAHANAPRLSPTARCTIACAWVIAKSLRSLGGKASKRRSIFPSWKFSNGRGRMRSSDAGCGELGATNQCLGTASHGWRCCDAASCHGWPVLMPTRARRVALSPGAGPFSRKWPLLNLRVAAFAVDNFEPDDLVSNFDQIATVTESMEILVSGHGRGCHVENRSVLAIR